MKLFTHNCLTSAMLKGVKVGFPLKIEATKVEEVSSDFNKNFILKMLSRIDYAALFAAASQLEKSDGLPKSRDEVSDAENNEELLRKLHHVLFEIEVIEGDLICPETGRRFPIANGIPNMLMNDDESK